MRQGGGFNVGGATGELHGFGVTERDFQVYESVVFDASQPPTLALGPLDLALRLADFACVILIRRL